MSSLRPGSEPIRSPLSSLKGRSAIMLPPGWWIT
nr:MAG TPA: hypothetical protein [Caudoviricetes sp.]